MMIKKAQQQPRPASNFDAEVDTARAKLEASLDEAPPFDDLGALHALMPLLQSRIASRRLSFTLGEDDEEGAQIVVVHVGADEELGFVFAEDGEYVFESAHADYFDDFVDDDSERFTERLYETLRADLPKFEVEHG